MISPSVEVVGYYTTLAPGYSAALFREGKLFAVKVTDMLFGTRCTNMTSCDFTENQ